MIPTTELKRYCVNKEGHKVVKQEGCHLAAGAELVDSLQHHLEIFRSDLSKRELLLSALLSLGTDYILKEEDQYTIMAASVVVAY